MKTFAECQDELAVEMGYIAWWDLIKFSDRGGPEETEMYPLAAKKYAEAAVLQDREMICDNIKEFTYITVNMEVEAFRGTLDNLPLPELK